MFCILELQTADPNARRRNHLAAVPDAGRKNFVGLLDKLNSKATTWSVLKASAFKGFLGACVGAVAIYFDDRQLSEHWIVAYALWIAGCMIVGAIIEWQVPKDTNLLIEPDTGSEPPTPS